MAKQRITWPITLALLALYGAGFAIGWGRYASWHLLLVIVVILLIFSLLASRGTLK